MATYHIDIDELRIGIGIQVMRLNRALTASELYEYVNEFIVAKYPDILMGELSLLSRETIGKINERERFEELQRARKRHWDRYTGCGSTTASDSASEYERRHQQQDKDFEQRMREQYVYGADFGKESEPKKQTSEDYSFTFKVDEAAYEQLTGSEWRNKVSNVQVPIQGLTGWSAPVGYNKYNGGNGDFKLCRPLPKKGTRLNTKAFESIPFQFIPSSLIID